MSCFSPFSTNRLMEKENGNKLLRQVTNTVFFLMSDSDLCLFPLPPPCFKSPAFPCCGTFAVALAFKVLQEMLFAELKGSCLLGLICLFPVSLNSLMYRGLKAFCYCTLQPCFFFSCCTCYSMTGSSLQRDLLRHCASKLFGKIPWFDLQDGICC